MKNSFELNEGVEKGWKTLYIIWMAMLIALFIYLLVGLSLKNKFEISINNNHLYLVRYIFYGISIMILFAIRRIRNYLLYSSDKAGNNSGFSNNPGIAKYITVTIVTLAMAEFIAILGLVLFLLGKNSSDLYLLIFISATAMIIYRPFKEQLVEFSNLKL